MTPVLVSNVAEISLLAMRALRRQAWHWLVAFAVVFGQRGTFGNDELTACHFVAGVGE